MRIEMFELSKRKGSLCLVVLLSLVLEACASRQPGLALRGGDSRPKVDPPNSVDITALDKGKQVDIAPGGTLTTTNAGASYLCFCSGSAAASPFTTDEICISANSTVPKTVKSENATYTWEYTNSNTPSCSVSVSKREKDDVTTGATGTLEVGTGDDGEEDRRPVR